MRSEKGSSSPDERYRLRVREIYSRLRAASIERRLVDDAES
jgi:hypothetical protein